MNENINMAHTAASALSKLSILPSPQWGAADAEIKVPSDENTELKVSLFEAWSRSVYCHACHDGDRRRRRQTKTEADEYGDSRRQRQTHSGDKRTGSSLTADDTPE